MYVCMYVSKLNVPVHIQLKVTVKICAVTAANLRLDWWINTEIRELISARNTSHKYNNKDLSRLRYLSPGMRVNTKCINSTRLINWVSKIVAWRASSLWSVLPGRWIPGILCSGFCRPYKPWTLIRDDDGLTLFTPCLYTIVLNKPSSEKLRRARGKCTGTLRHSWSADKKSAQFMFFFFVLPSTSCRLHNLFNHSIFRYSASW